MSVGFLVLVLALVLLRLILFLILVKEALLRHLFLVLSYYRWARRVGVHLLCMDQGRVVLILCRGAARANVCCIV